MPNDRMPRRCLGVGVDVVAYGPRDDRRQYVVQKDLIELLDESAAQAKLHRAGWMRQAQGDGEIALLPAGEPEVQVLDDFVQHLHSALRHHDDDHSAATRIRLRVAMHHGVVRPADNGVAGDSVVHLARLLDAAPLRAALAAAADAPLAVLLSDLLYRDLVAAGHTVVRPGEFRAVTVAEKEVHERAWLRVPGVDVHALDLGAATPPLPAGDDAAHLAPEGGGGTRDEVAAGVDQDADARWGGEVTQAGGSVHRGPSVVNTFEHEVDARGAVFGFSETRVPRQNRGDR